MCLNNSSIYCKHPRTIYTATNYTTKTPPSHEMRSDSTSTCCLLFSDPEDWAIHFTKKKKKKAKTRISPIKNSMMIFLLQELQNRDLPLLRAHFTLFAYSTCFSLYFSLQFPVVLRPLFISNEFFSHWLRSISHQLFCVFFARFAEWMSSTFSESTGEAYCRPRAVFVCTFQLPKTGVQHTGSQQISERRTDANDLFRRGC